MISLLVLLGLAAYYVTYVVTQSDFPPVENMRVRVHDRWAGAWQDYLFHCGWCVSAYASAVVVGVSAQWMDVPVPGVVWLAVAAISGMLIFMVNGVLDTYGIKLMKDLREGSTKPTSAVAPKARRRGRT